MTLPKFFRNLLRFSRKTHFQKNGKLLLYKLSDLHVVITGVKIGADCWGNPVVLIGNKHSFTLMAMYLMVNGYDALDKNRAVDSMHVLKTLTNIIRK